MRVRWLLACLLLGSGFCSLIYQTVWQNLLRLSFGASTLASAAVLSVFMGGLGFGALLIGRRSDLHPKPLKPYALLDLAIAVWALHSPLFLDVCQSIYLTLGGVRELGTLGATLLRLALSALCIGPAAFLTLPAAVRALGEEPSGGLARIYGANTLGAVAGALTGPLLAFAHLGIRTTLFSAAGLNLVIAGVAWVLGTEPSVAPAPAATSPSVSGRSPVLPLVIAFFTGFISLGREIVWFRLLSPILGDRARPSVSSWAPLCSGSASEAFVLNASPSVVVLR